mgnify:CR=1 FL=1
MKLLTKLIVNLNTKEVVDTMTKASRKGLKDTIVEIADDAIEHSPKKTGNNARSIKWETGPGSEIAKEDLSAAAYSTSGYGGFLEVGTVSMGARPYFQPALDKHGGNLGKNIERHMP